MVYNFTSEELFSLIPSWKRSETDTIFFKKATENIRFFNGILQQEIVLEITYSDWQSYTGYSITSRYVWVNVPSFKSEET